MEACLLIDKRSSRDTFSAKRPKHPLRIVNRACSRSIPRLPISSRSAVPTLFHNVVGLTMDQGTGSTEIRKFL